MSKIIRRTILLLFLVILAVGYFQWNMYGQKIELREEALLYFKEEDYSKTIKYLQQALDKRSVFGNKIDHDMRCYMAESYYQLEQYDKAEKIYDQLLKDSEKEKKCCQQKNHSNSDYRKHTLTAPTALTYNQYFPNNRLHT